MSRQTERVVEFTAGDGLQCNVINVRGEQAPTKGPVLLVHGAGVRANIFRAPSGRNLVDLLVDGGWDVWLENWRASIEIPHNHWTLDQAAVYDHPQAVQTVCAQTGADEIKAVIHCQGSTSFMMSALAGLVPQVTHDRLQRRLDSSGRPTAREPEAAQHDPRDGEGAGLPGSAVGESRCAVDRAQARRRLDQARPSRVRQQRVQVVELHLRHRQAHAVASREPQRAHARMAQGRVRGGAADLLLPDPALRAGRPSAHRRRPSGAAARSSPPKRQRPTLA